MKLKVVNDPDKFEGRVSIIINSCDAYEDVRGLFSVAFKEFFKNNPFPVVVNTESSPLLGYSDYEKSNTTWGKRLIDLLNAIDSEYVIVLFDDFILEDHVNLGKIYSALEILRSDNKSAVFYLNAASVSDHPDDPNNDYRVLKQNADYRLNSVPSIWRRECLLEFTDPVDNPWSWEVFGSYRTFKSGLNFYSASSQVKNIFSYNYSKGGAIYRGKWVRDVVDSKIKKYKLPIDLKKRGFVDLDTKIDRSFKWKIQFIIMGFNSIGFSMFIFIKRAIFKKYLATK